MINTMAIDEHVIKIKLVDKLILDSDFNYILLKVREYNEKRLLCLVNDIRDIFISNCTENNYALILKGSLHRKDAHCKSDFDLGLISLHSELQKALNLRDELCLKFEEEFSIQNYSESAISKMKNNFSFWTAVFNNTFLMGDMSIYNEFISTSNIIFNKFSINELLQLYFNDINLKNCNKSSKVLQYKYGLGGFIDYEFYLLITRWELINRKVSNIGLIYNNNLIKNLYQYLVVYKYLHLSNLKSKYWFGASSIHEEICFYIRSSLRQKISVL